MSWGRGNGKGAVVLTIAAIILISGLYVRLSYAGAESFQQSPYVNYHELKSATFGIGAGQSSVQEFEGRAGEKVSLTLQIIVSDSPPQISPAHGGDASADGPLPRIAVNVTDAAGKSLAHDESIGRSYSIQPIEIENSGRVSVSVANLEDTPIQVSMNLRKAHVQAPVDTGYETFSNWLMIVSIPVFALGAWLMAPRKEDKAKDGQRA